MSLLHYTDASAVMSIVQNKELWLTDIRFMNDSEEVIDGAKHISQAVKNLNISGDASHDIALKHLQDFNVDDVLTDLNDAHMFLCSFSRAKDLLSQWRSYGLYAIEFDELIIGESAELSNCIYNPYEKFVKAKELVTKAREEIACELYKEDLISTYDAMQYIWALGDAVTLFKHQSFSEENEVRIIQKENSFSEEINYRARGDHLIPYLKLQFPLEAVKAIHIGPMKHQALAAASMKSFINNIDIFHQKPNFQGKLRIEVICSNTPYRAI